MTELIGQAAVHKTRIGARDCTVLDITETDNGSYITVGFDNGCTMKLSYPNAFEDFLFLKDNNLQAKMQQILEDEKARIIEEKEQQRNNRKTKKKDEWNTLNTSYPAIETVLKRASLDLQQIEAKGRAQINKPEIIMDYDNDWEQAAYILRYSYAYAYEYYLMHSEILRFINRNKSVKVLSIGCGAMTDAWALDVAGREEGEAYRIEYTGIDLAHAWNPSYHPKTEDIIKYPPLYDTCAGTYLSSLSVIDYDVFVFPKSLRDICWNDNGDFIKILHSFENNHILRDSIVLAFSLTNNPISPNNDELLRKDGINIKEILSSLHKNGFEIVESIINTKSDDRVYYRSGYPEISEMLKGDSKRLTDRKMMTSKSYQKFYIYKLKRKA